MSSIGTMELVTLALVCAPVFFLLLLLASAIRVVPETQRLSVFRLGRYIGEVGPGLVLLLPVIDRAIQKDISDQVSELQADDRIWGAIGTTLTTVHTSGEIELSGKYWNATSQESLPPGTRVRIKQVILEVERV